MFVGPCPRPYLRLRVQWIHQRRELKACLRFRLSLQLLVNCDGALPAAILELGIVGSLICSDSCPVCRVINRSIASDRDVECSYVLTIPKNSILNRVICVYALVLSRKPVLGFPKNVGKFWII